MMKDVLIVADNIISPLGNSTSANFEALLKNESGVREHVMPAISPDPFFAALITGDVDTMDGDYSRFESLAIASVKQAAEQAALDIHSPDTVFILSSTKGNIAMLETMTGHDDLRNSMSLSATAEKIAKACGLVHPPIVISNACISGLTALLTGKRLLESGQYKQAVVTGADLVSRFILSGFQSFQAVSSQPCRPFDAARNGINLGEAAATIILSTEGPANAIRLAGGAISNDANHISGPSRTGEELAIAIRRALAQAGLDAGAMDFISAHGTATLYNDEMEAKAFSIAGMQETPLNSLKGYYGHTLGAAGVLESAIAIESLRRNMMIGTQGYSQLGVSKPVNVCRDNMPLKSVHCLKTGSGFGGCNAALVFSKPAV